MSDHAEVLRSYLKVGFDALRWKLDGLSEYDLRRPLTPTGTNLLGVAKHLAMVSAEYFGLVFGRPSAVPQMPEDGDNADMWATADEPAETVIAWLDLAAAEAQATLTELPLDAPGHVPWWGPKADTTLLMIAVHMLAELHRHAGQVDIVREIIDGKAGWREGNSNLPGDEFDWPAYVAQLQSLADTFR